MIECERREGAHHDETKKSCCQEEQRTEVGAPGHFGLVHDVRRRGGETCSFGFGGWRWGAMAFAYCHGGLPTVCV